MNCQFCNKDFSNKSSLINHQKTAKYCLKLQDTDKEISNFNCDYCKKLFTSRQNLNIHLAICKDKEIEILRKEKDKEIEILRKEKDKDIEILRKEKDKEIEILRKGKDKQENNYKEQIKELQQIIERMSLKAIERPTTTNNNNTLNITSFMDFNNMDKIKNAIEDKLDINYVVDGQKGLAHFVKDNLLTDDTGRLLYICTDPSRQIFKYKDSSGEVKKDVEAKKLTNYILEGGIRTKSAVLGNDWCKDDKGDINVDRFNVMMEQQQSIMKLSDDNNSFKKELVSLTS